MGLRRGLFQHPHTRNVGVTILVTGCAILAIWTMWRVLGPTPAIAASTRGQYICAQTGKPFTLTLEAGMTLPVLSPHSGTKTGYPAELCYWTRDGQIRKEPVPVLLNSYLGKRDPTFCPDCGRLVRSRNPQPVPGFPPPTREQYKKQVQEE